MTRTKTIRLAFQDEVIPLVKDFANHLVSVQARIEEGNTILAEARNELKTIAQGFIKRLENLIVIGKESENVALSISTNP